MIKATIWFVNGDLIMEEFESEEELDDFLLNLMLNYISGLGEEIESVEIEEGESEYVS